jgi:DNA-binding beta-propeller fold protein YncE
VIYRIGGASVVLLGALVAGCAKSESGGFDDAPPGPDGGRLAPSDAGSPQKDPVVNGEVFGHSENRLFRVDTATHVIAEVGFFQGCTYVADIALDAKSNMYASTGTELHLIENNTGRCTRVAQGTFPNSLSFVPAGTIVDLEETLVGFQGGDYVKIDPATGKVEKLGSLGGGFESSGDVVSAKGAKTFVTVRGPGCADCLAEIDPKTGKMTKNWGPLGKSDVFGLAFWGGELYAFTNAGELALVTFVGDKLDVKTLPITNAPSSLKFWGAGSTTSAPVGPVR